jgi:hypothetical protein
VRKQARPPFEAEEIFDACIERFTDVDYKKRVNAEKKTILAAGLGYASSGLASKLHEIRPIRRIGAVSNADMRRLYNQGMLRRKSIARRYYEDIRLSSPHNICPICNHRPVATLEHYLAKSSFSHFTVHPDNLIPSCYDCNFSKNDAIFDTFENSPLHPYFDNPGSGEWLMATIVEVSPILPVYSVSKSALSPTMRTKVNNHLDTFKLRSLYSQEGAAELARNRGISMSFFKYGGADAHRAYLQKKRASILAVEPNSWRAALYSACASNDWYIECKWAA